MCWLLRELTFVRSLSDRTYCVFQVTKLVENYRSHPGLLCTPSCLFYHNELVPSGPPEMTHCMVGWEGLSSPTVPLIFHGVRVGINQSLASLCTDSFGGSRGRLLTHSLTHSHSLTHPPTHSLTHPFIYPPTNSSTHYINTLFDRYCPLRLQSLRYFLCAA